MPSAWCPSSARLAPNQQTTTGETWSHWPNLLRGGACTAGASAGCLALIICRTHGGQRRMAGTKKIHAGPSVQARASRAATRRKRQSDAGSDAMATKKDLPAARTSRAEGFEDNLWRESSSTSTELPAQAVDASNELTGGRDGTKEEGFSGEKRRQGRTKGRPGQLI